MSTAKEILSVLSDSCGFGGMSGTAQAVKTMAAKYMEIKTHGSGLIGFMPGTSDKTLMLDAHIDEIGMYVTEVDSNGFVKVNAAGGIDSRILSAERVLIFGKQTVDGVFCSTPPHLRAEKKEDCSKIEDMLIDTGLGEKAADIISVGDCVSYKPGFKELVGNRVSGKSLDNRAGVTALLRCADLIHDTVLPLNIAFSFSDMEEVGLRGAKTSAFAISPDYAIAVDVSFGDCPLVSPEKTGYLGKGPMIGISPVLSRRMTDKLFETAENKGIKYQSEIMGGATSTNADVISLTKTGVETALVSIPLRNMHTPAEVADLTDIEATASLLAEFILSAKEFVL